MKKDLTEGVDFYYEDGRMVFTEKFHLDRGRCCRAGCRHCPWGYQKIKKEAGGSKI